MGNRNRETAINEKLATLVEDNPNVLANLIDAGYNPDSEIVEILTTLPAAVDIDVFIGTVMRWVNICEYFNRPIRVYAWSYNQDTEKIFTQLVQERKEVFLTPLPGYLRGELSHA